MKTVLMSAVLLSVAFTAGGCMDRAVSPHETESQLFTISPNDGATNVNLDASLVLSLRRPVEGQVVMRNLFLISEKGMADSLCPVSPSMGHGMMTLAMLDSATMHHLDQYHSMPGTFSWNSDSTRCTFRPDSMMAPKTLYMVHFDRSMVQMMESQIGGMPMMSGRGSGMMSGEMLFHFTTGD